MMTATAKKQRRHIALLLMLTVGMFGFAFALVPLYDIFCELTGLNGKTGGAATYTVADKPTSDRVVTIQFLGHVGNGMPWEFRPTEDKLVVGLDEMKTTTFYARNRASQGVTGQAVPSVTPGLAAQYLRKVECFCFEQQLLQAGEEVEMPVTFFIDPDLPEDIQTLSLSYTLFWVKDVKTVGAALGATSL